MTEELKISDSNDKGEVYQSLLPQIEALISEEPDSVAKLANVAAALKYGMGFFWVGFYLIKEGELVLGPFQGPIACTRIQKGRGVCGVAWEQEKTIIVDDVEKFPGHIVCNASSKSEIVVPIKKDKEVVGVLDIDSDSLNSFDDVDRRYLEQLCDKLS